MAGANAEVDVSLDNMIRMHYVLCPQSPEKMSEILMQGYHDAVAFLTKHGQIRHACGKCLTVKTTFSPQDVLKVSLVFLHSFIFFFGFLGICCSFVLFLIVDYFFQFLMKSALAHQFAWN